MWGANAILGVAAAILLLLNHREAAFDPLDPKHYLGWLPRIRRRTMAPPQERPRVALRVPPSSRFRLPGLLDRYVARQYLGFLALIVGGFWSISLLAHFLDLFDDIQQNRVKGYVVVHYYTFFAPAFLHLVAPVAFLVATLTTFGVLSRRNEITAMKAGGISVYRATVPAVFLGLLGCLGLFVLGEYILPHTNKVAARDFDVIKGRPPKRSTYLERRWIRGEDGRLYNYDFMEERTYKAGPAEPERHEVSLHRLAVFDIDPQTWDLRERIYAARARWNGVTYDLEQGWRRSFGAEARFRAFEEIRTREVEPPGYFKREEPESDMLAYADLKRHIAGLEELGVDVVKLKVQLHKKLALPAVSLVMTIIGIPFAFVVGRRGALYGIGLSVIIAIVYWACLGIFEAMGNHAMLPAPLAAWAPNLLFAAAGLYLMLTLDT
jgi:LPS export ABC transporter permease LptG